MWGCSGVTCAMGRARAGVATDLIPGTRGGADSEGQGESAAKRHPRPDWPNGTQTRNWSTSCTTSSMWQRRRRRTGVINLGVPIRGLAGWDVPARVSRR